MRHLPDVVFVLKCLELQGLGQGRWFVAKQTCLAWVGALEVVGLCGLLGNAGFNVFFPEESACFSVKPG